MATSKNKKVELVLNISDSISQKVELVLQASSSNISNSNFLNEDILPSCSWSKSSCKVLHEKSPRLPYKGKSPCLP